MNDKMDLLCAGLRLRLHAIDRTVEEVAAGPIGVTSVPRADAAVDLERLRTLIDDDNEGVDLAEQQVAKWTGFQREAAALRQTAMPGDATDSNQRADDAEAYAFAVLHLAHAASRQAAHAVLEALMARADADAACLAPTDPSLVSR